MKGKLIKMVEGYTLSLTGSIDDLYGISNKQLATDHGLYKLSLKNCKAIENGYDLDELAEEKYHGHVMAIDWQLEKRGFITGFQKALEILGDKKYSEMNMEDAYYFGSKKLREEYLDFIKTFQQKTEWDVEIEMESKDIDELRVDKGSFLKPNDIYKPKLDKDGCLILKRK
jgi:hypothetical protein